MKRVGVMLMLAWPLLSQVYRVDPASIMTIPGISPSGGMSPVYTVSDATVKLCLDSACTVAAQTYTDYTGSVPCPSNSQVVWAGMSVCAATTDKLGNFGFWVAAGSYYYTVTLKSGTKYGPFALPNIFTLPNFQVPFAGSVPRTYQQKLAEVLNVTDFGAVCNGLTDDSTSIAASVSAALSLAEPLLAPPSCYSASGTPISGAALPMLWLARTDNTHVYTPSGDQMGNAPAGSVARFETVTGTANADAVYNVMSLVWEHNKTAAFPLGPNNVNVGGYFYAFGDPAGGGVKALEALNPLVQWDARPIGVVDVSGTAVTWVSGSTFDASGRWDNAGIEINFVPYMISTVADIHNLTLKSTAGVQSGVDFTVGGAVIGVEIDVNNRWRDVDPHSGNFYNGLAVVSGHNYKPLTGITVGATQGATNAWRNAAILTAFTERGLYVAAAESDHATGIEVNMGGSAGQAAVFRGQTQLTGIPNNLLVLTPSDDSYGAEIYGTDAANTNPLWAIYKTGAALLPSISFTPDNGSTPGLLMSQAGANQVRFTPVSDTPTGVEVYGTDAGNANVKWLIRQNGSAQFNGLTAVAGLSTNVFTIAPSVPSTSTSACAVGQASADSDFLYVCYATDHWIRVAKDATAW